MPTTLKIRLMVLAMGLGVCVVIAGAQDSLAKIRSRFSQETDPVRKARLMPELANTEFQEISKDFQADKLPDALVILKQYRDEARSCVNGLDARNIDAEKHPAGFKQLQFSLRSSLRRLSDLLVTLTRDEQEPFEATRKDIEDMDRHVIQELFPRQPAGDGLRIKN